MKGQITTRTTCSFYSPSNNEVRQSNNEGANGHQYTTYCNDLWPVELGTKVTDESNHQQVTWQRGKKRKDRSIRDLHTLKGADFCCIFFFVYCM